MTIPVYINNFNRLTWLQWQLTYLETVPDIEVVIIDNASTFPPLVDWYDRKCPVRVVRLSENRGPRAAWTGCVRLRRGTYFAVTDPDLDLSEVPADFVSVLIGGLEDNPSILKCGLSLEINDIPDGMPMKRAVLKREGCWWVTRHNSTWWKANVATTMAVYRAARPRCNYGPALRSDRPYTARHLPWYITPGSETYEDWYYWRHLQFKNTLGWSPRDAKHRGVV